MLFQRWLIKRLSQVLATHETRQRAAHTAELQITTAVWKFLALKLVHGCSLEQRRQLADGLDNIVDEVRRAAELEMDHETAMYLAQGAQRALQNIKISLIEGGAPFDRNSTAPSSTQPSDGRI